MRAPPTSAPGRPAAAGGFTLFEAVVALAIFALAFGGLAVALDSAIGSGITAREASRARRELETRLAYSLVDPPVPGQERVIEARENRGVGVEERLDQFEAVNEDGERLAGLWQLKIRVKVAGVSADADTVIYRP